MPKRKRFFPVDVFPNGAADAETDVDADADAQASGSNLLPLREARCLQVGARDVLGRAQLPKAISTG